MSRLDWSVDPESTCVDQSFADAVDLCGDHDAFLVTIETDRGGRHHRRVYLTHEAAENAVHRACDQGHGGHVVLVSLEPSAYGWTWPPC